MNGCKFEFSPKFALSNFKGIRQVAAQVRPLSQMCLVELLPDNLYCVGGDVKPCSIQSIQSNRTSKAFAIGGGAVAQPLRQLGFLVRVGYAVCITVLCRFSTVWIMEQMGC